MQVETESSGGGIGASNVESALLFETPEMMCQRVFREIRPRTPAPMIDIQFRPFANANSSIELKNGKLRLAIADVFEGAPAPVLEALLFILLSKLYRKPVPRHYSHRYRLWLSRKDVRRTVHLVRQTRGRKQMGPPAGEYFDLIEVFESVNQRFFHGLLARPELGWSRTRSKVRLGHYDPSHNAIVLSRALDSPNATRLTVDYVMYHEMLHLLHPEEYSGSKRRVHTRDFRQAEKRFPNLDQAKKELRELLCSD